MNWFDFLLRNRGEVLERSVEHMGLVAASMGIALLIGLPLGIALVRRNALQRWVLGAANIVQTIPSLALFGFLIPVPWIGGVGASRGCAKAAPANSAIRAKPEANPERESIFRSPWITCSFRRPMVSERLGKRIHHARHASSKLSMKNVNYQVLDRAIPALPRGRNRRFGIRIRRVRRRWRP